MSILVASFGVLMSSTLLVAAPQTTPGVSESQRAAIEKAVLEVNAQMTQAAQARDFDRLFSFMLETDKGSVIQNGKLWLTREEALAQTKNSFQGIRKVDYVWKRQFVSVASPTVAILIAEGESSATTEQGETFARPFAQTVVFVLKGGQWKALHAHQSSPLRQ